MKSITLQLLFISTRSLTIKSVPLTDGHLIKIDVKGNHQRNKATGDSRSAHRRHSVGGLPATIMRAACECQKFELQEVLEHFSSTASATELFFLFLRCCILILPSKRHSNRLSPVSCSECDRRRAGSGPRVAAALPVKILFPATRSTVEGLRQIARWVFSQMDGCFLLLSRFHADRRAMTRTEEEGQEPRTSGRRHRRLKSPGSSSHSTFSSSTH